MSQNKGKRSLEKFWVFPYIAWALIGLFAFFVYNLTTEVTVVTERLQSTQLEKSTILERNTETQDQAESAS